MTGGEQRLQAWRVQTGRGAGSAATHPRERGMRPHRLVPVMVSQAPGQPVGEPSGERPPQLPHARCAWARQQMSQATATGLRHILVRPSCMSYAHRSAVCSQPAVLGSSRKTLLRGRRGCGSLHCSGSGFRDLQQPWVAVVDAPQGMLQEVSAAGPACCSHWVRAFKYAACRVHRRRSHIGDYLIRCRLGATRQHSTSDAPSSLPGARLALEASKRRRGRHKGRGRGWGARTVTAAGALALALPQPPVVQCDHALVVRSRPVAVPSSGPRGAP